MELKDMINWVCITILLPTLCENISPWPDIQCPIGCACAYEQFPYVVADHSLRTIDCTHAELTRVPTNISSSTEALVLRRGKLSIGVLGQIPPNLTLLDLSYGQLYTLDYGLPIMPFMKYLNLEHNELDYVNNRTFQTLRELSGLYLSHNTIEMLHVDAFCGLGRLTILDLSHNRLFSLDVRWFRELTSLKNLLLHDNNIHVVPSKVFSNLVLLDILTLHSNQIKSLADDGFSGLKKLSALLLNNNHLASITSKPFQVFKDLDLLDLSNNHIVRLQRGALQGFNVSQLKISNMKDLHLIERRAIVNIQTLNVLDLSNNPSLVYIERRAFVLVPKLHSLHLNANNLSTLEVEVIQALPSLAALSLNDNPLYCDCTLIWLTQLMRQGHNNITLEKMEQMACITGPPDLQSQPLVSIPPAQFTGQCPPRILPLFAPNHEVLLGDKIQLDCRAVGQPIPQIAWILPSNERKSTQEKFQIIKAASKLGSDDRIFVSTSGSLHINMMKNGDQGQWSCMATSPEGRDQKFIQVLLRNPQANVIVISVTDSSISVTWQSSKFQRDYRMLYREVNANESYTIVEILPYMRSYTATALNPRTKYEFCIAVDHEGNMARLNCSVIATKAANTFNMGQINARTSILGGALACLFVMSVFITIISCMIRRYNHRRRSAEELLGADYLSQVYLAGIDAMSDTTPITYENRGIDLGSEDEDEGSGHIYKPPSEINESYQ